jgi:hypothetical protein
VRMRGRIVTGVIMAGMIAAVAGCGGSSAGGSTAGGSTAGGSTAGGSSGGGKSGSAAKASGTPASPAASATTPAQAAGGKPAQAPPRGYQWVGGPQAVWLAVPDSWIALNLARISLNEAMRRFAVRGTNLMKGSSLMTGLKAIRKQHGIMVADLASSATSPHHFTVNLNAFCVPTPLEQTGTSVTPLISAMKAQYAPLHPTHLSEVPVKIQGSPAVKGEVTLNTSVGLLTDLQYVVIHHARLCSVTMSTEEPAKSSRTFATIASTIQLPGSG